MRRCCCRRDDVGVTLHVPRGLVPRRRSSRRCGDATLQLRRGETLGIVGESGSGKTTLGMALLALQPIAGGDDRRRRPAHRQRRPRARCARCAGACRWCSRTRSRRCRPRMTVGQIVGEGLALHRPELGAGRARRAGARRCSTRSGLSASARRGRRAAALSARVLRRPAPAHRHRARGGAAARGAGARRADLGARRLGAAAGAGAAGRAAARATA